MKGNLTVMSEMLNELKPGQSPPDDAQLLKVGVWMCETIVNTIHFQIVSRCPPG